MSALRGVSSSLASLITAIALLLVPAPCLAQRTWSFLTTGNGHGFEVYDANQRKITTFLEHPYRYLRAAADPKSDGIGRRNLAFDFYFGLRAPGGTVWLKDGAATADPEYVDQSNIIHTPLQGAGVSADVYYFAPFGYEGNAMVALIHAPAASDAFALFNFHMGSAGGNDTMPGANGESLSAVAEAQAVVETGPGGGAMVYVPLSGVDAQDCDNVYNKVSGGGALGMNTGCAGNDVVPAFGRKLGGAAGGWWAVAVAYTDNAGDAANVAKALKAWGNGRAPDQILDDARKEFEAWRKPPPGALQLSADELKTWRQGESTLRMGQVREPNTSNRKSNGMVLASLPPGEWHTGWVRDMTYALVGLARMGHVAEAKAGLDFFLQTGPVGAYKSYVNNQDYRISVVRYYGDGAEQADYSGQPTPNVEVDGWGLVLWAARQYIDASGDAGWLTSPAPQGDGRNRYDVLAEGVAGPLAGMMEGNGIIRADSSIWEVHDANKRHYAYTTLAAARGFCDMATMAQRAGKAADVGKYQDLSGKVVKGFLGVFLDTKGAIAGSLEGLQRNLYTDAAVVEAFNWGIVNDYAGKTAMATFDRLNQLRVQSGGFKRNDDNASSYDNNEWILIDLRMSSALRRAGRDTAAQALIDQVVKKAADNYYLLPELYNAVQQDGQIGKYTGSIPMVGYGGGALAMTLLDRAGLTEPSDCGQSVLTDAGVTRPDGGGGPGPGPGGSDGGGNNSVDIPYVDACPCGIGRSHGDRAGWYLLPGLSVLALLVARRRRGRA